MICGGEEGWFLHNLISGLLLICGFTSVFERREKAKLEKLKREIAKREKAKDTSNLGRPQCNSGSFEAKELGHEDVKKDILFEADSHRNNKRSRDRFKCEA